MFLTEKTFFSIFLILRLKKVLIFRREKIDSIVYDFF